MKKQSPDKVDLLLTSQSARIESVCEDTLSLMLDKTIDFDDKQPCYIGGRPFTIIGGKSEVL